jgi:hypothetical protein
MRNLIEGLRKGDLEDLVLPFFSLDEYQSNIDDSAIVIGFYVQEKGAAEDLNRFIQRSPVEILDTQISPAPDSQGYFMVFVELLNNAKLPENIEHILEEIASLTTIESWKMKVRGLEDLVAFTPEAVRDGVADQEPDPVRESVLTFLAQSSLLDARFEADKLILESARNSYEYELVAFGSQETVISEQRLDERASNLSLTAAVVPHSCPFAGGAGTFLPLPSSFPPKNYFEAVKSCAARTSEPHASFV